MTFNTASHFKPFVFVDEMCEIHNVKKYLVQVTNKTACRLCVQEEILAREQQLAKEKYEKHVITRREYYLYTFPEVNEELRNASFPSYVPQTKEEADVKRSDMRIAKAYIDGANNNTIFSGDSGTGKSHLAYAIIKNYAHKTNKLAKLIENFQLEINKAINEGEMPSQFLLSGMEKYQRLNMQIMATIEKQVPQEGDSLKQMIQEKLARYG